MAHPIESDPDFQRLTPYEQKQVLDSLNNGGEVSVKAPPRKPSLGDALIGYEANKYLGGSEAPEVMSKMPSFSEMMSGGGATTPAFSVEGAMAAEAGGYTSIPAGAAIPEGFSAVGTAADGGTLIGPSSVATPSAGVPYSVNPVVGIPAGAYGNYDVFKNKKHGGKGALQAGMSTYAMTSWLGPQVSIPASIAAATLGYFGNFGDNNRFQDEYDRAQILRDKGINWGLNSEMPSKGRSKEELIAIEKANVDAGKHGNLAFAESRNEADLTPSDITGYAALPEAFGEKYANASQAAKEAAAKILLDAKAVREHHGTVDITVNPEIEKQIEGILAAPPTGGQKTSGDTGGDGGGEKKEKKRKPSIVDIKFPTMTEPPDLGYRPKIGISNVMQTLGSRRPSYTSL